MSTTTKPTTSDRVVSAPKRSKPRGESTVKKPTPASIRQRIAKLQNSYRSNVWELERTVMYHLADLLICASFTGIKESDAETMCERAVELLTPLAKYSKHIARVLTRLRVAVGQRVDYEDAIGGEDNELSRDTDPAVIVARISERDNFTKTTTMWDADRFPEYLERFQAELAALTAPCRAASVPTTIPAQAA